MKTETMEKFYITILITMIFGQYGGYYLFAGWRGVVCALFNMILYGVIAFYFKRQAEEDRDRMQTYRAELFNLNGYCDELQRALFNANQILMAHGLRFPEEPFRGETMIRKK
jgi:hypothetical protein